MAKELLVEEQIRDGHQLVLELLRVKFDVTVAFWVRTSEDGLWLLYISSASVDEKKVAEGYRQVYACLNLLPSSWISPSEVKLLHPSNPISVAAVLVRDRYPAKTATCYHGKRLASLRIIEAYIYPRQRWFNGFDEMKQKFPSSEIFTIPVLTKDFTNPITRQSSGRINASAFEGREPGTVFFLGPQGTSADAVGELVFIHRPEGWNTLFREETNSWEEVVFVNTGKKLYEAADFSLLLALKTDQKPSTRNLEAIRTLMEQGGYSMRLPGSATPIYSIPSILAWPGDEPTTINWEEIRRILEAGGTINVVPISQSEIIPAGS
jgi:hypothetical protein